MWFRNDIKHFFWHTASCMLRNTCSIKQISKIWRFECLIPCLPRYMICSTGLLPATNGVQISFVPLKCIDIFNHLRSSISIEFILVFQKVVPHKDIQRKIPSNMYLYENYHIHQEHELFQLPSSSLFLFWKVFP